jgi:hypothetical protein
MAFREPDRILVFTWRRMICPSCGVRLKCRYSAPAGARLRYRGYRCVACKTYLETVELPVAMYETGRDREEVLALVDAVKRQQQRFIKRPS